MTSPSSRGLLGARDLALVAVFVGIMAALGTVPAFFPFGVSVPITAQKIVDYRTENGPFTSVDQLLDVSGIGDATLEDIRELVTV